MLGLHNWQITKNFSNVMSKKLLSVDFWTLRYFFSLTDIEIHLLYEDLFMLKIWQEKPYYIEAYLCVIMCMMV